MVIVLVTCFLYKYRFYAFWGRLVVVLGTCYFIYVPVLWSEGGGGDGAGGHVTLYKYRFYGPQICTGSVLSGGGGDGVGDMLLYICTGYMVSGGGGDGVGDMLLYISTGSMVSGEVVMVLGTYNFIYVLVLWFLGRW